MYPLTVVNDRYGGTYSDGNFTAWPKLFYQVPREIEGNDIECATFWSDADKSEIGIGDTIQKAVNDLTRKIEAKFKDDFGDDE